ncbi:MAG: glycosyltransferase [Betaproteobacteria bacterium]|nr:glycosyltransferase [Betaproteobacteria bacterium]
MAPGSRPLVTIVVPSFNQGDFIRETLESCLSQDYRPIEILVIDGGSKDKTVAVLKSIVAPEIRWWSEPDNGVVDAVNRG